MMNGSELDRLIAKVERLRRQLGGLDLENHSPLALLRLECLEATQVVRECLHIRDKLESQGLAHTVEGIRAASDVRRELNKLSILADRLREAHAQQDRRKTPPEDIEEVVHILNLVKACLDNEKRRLGSRDPPQNSRPYTPQLLGGGPKVDGTLGRRTPADPETQASLIALADRDRQMDQSLDAIIDGLGKLKGIAFEMHEDVNLQSVMIDEIIAKAESADHELRNINKRLNKVLRQVGGASRVSVNIVLVIVIVSLLLFIYKTIRDGNFDPIP